MGGPLAFGLWGNGVGDESDALTAALANPKVRILEIPEGIFALDHPIVMPDRDVQIVIDPLAVFKPRGDIAIFEAPDGLTDVRTYRIHGGVFQGDRSKNQELVCMDDANGRADFIFRDCKGTGLKVLADWMQYNTNYDRQSNVWTYNCRFTAVPGGSTLAKTPNPAGTFGAPVGVRSYECEFLYALADDFTAVYGWGGDADCDVWFENCQKAYMAPGAKFNGLQCVGTDVGIYGAGDIRFFGNAWDVWDYISTGSGVACFESDLTTGDVYKTGRLILDGSDPIVDLSYCTSVGLKFSGSARVRGKFNDPIGISVPAIELVGSHGVVDGAKFIKIGSPVTVYPQGCVKLNAVSFCKVAHSHFDSTITGATVVETGASDSNIVEKSNTGLQNGTGLSLLDTNGTLLQGETDFEGRLQLDSATQLSLQRYKGRAIHVSGEDVVIPSAGLALLNTAHTISAAGADSGAVPAVTTLHYAYVSNSVATFAPKQLRLSTTAPTARRGVKYLAASGNGRNWRFVGWVYTISNSGTANFADSLTQRFVVNYYHRRKLPLKTVPAYEDSGSDTATSYTFTGTSYAPINGGTADKVEFISNGEDDVDYRGEGFGSTAVTAGFYRMGVGEDSDATAAVVAQGQQATGLSGQVLPFSCGRRVTIAEGYHYLRLLAQDSGGTSTWFANGRKFGGTDKPEGTRLVASIMG